MAMDGCICAAIVCLAIAFALNMWLLAMDVKRWRCERRERRGRRGHTRQERWDRATRDVQEI